MNLAKLKQNVGYHVQVVPVACHLDEYGLALPERNEDWFIQEVTNEHVRLSIGTGHFIVLGTDHIHHFTSDPQRSRGGANFGFLSLHVQIFIQGIDAWVKPNLRPGEAMPPPSVNITDKLVDISYPTDSGLQQKLNASGFRLHWCSESNLSRRIDLDGWQVVLEPAAGGGVARFRVKDRIDDLILIKKST